MNNNTIEQLKYLIAEQLDVNIQLSEIDEDAPLLDDGLNLDSLAIVELITLMERRFGVEFGEDDLNMDSFASLRTMAGVIDSHRARQQQAPMQEVSTGIHTAAASCD